jgi:hypothetical protein
VSRLIHVHAEATVGRVQNAGNAVELERQAEADPASGGVINLCNALHTVTSRTRAREGAMVQRCTFGADMARADA